MSEPQSEHESAPTRAPWTAPTLEALDVSATEVGGVVTQDGDVAQAGS